MIRRLRLVPGPLALLLVVATIVALGWIVLMPPLQGPDEVSHFTYVQRIYEDHTIPWTPRGSSMLHELSVSKLQEHHLRSQGECLRPLRRRACS